jgi:hypothetical protein
MKKRSRLKISILVFLWGSAGLILLAYLVGHLLLDMPIVDIVIVTGLSLLAAGTGAFGSLIVDTVKGKKG